MIKYLLIVLLIAATQQTDEETYDQYFNVRVSIAQVLDGYSKDFTAVLAPLSGKQDYHYILWLCLQTGDGRRFWSVLGIEKGAKYIFPVLFGGNGMVLDYQNFDSQVDVIDEEDGTQSLLMTVKRDVSKGTTFKITFLKNDRPEAQNEILEHIINLVAEQAVIGPNKALEENGGDKVYHLNHYCEYHFRTNLPHKERRHAPPPEEIEQHQDDL